jgi:hypothetical protein
MITRIAISFALIIYINTANSCCIAQCIARNTHGVPKPQIINIIKSTEICQVNQLIYTMRESNKTLHGIYRINQVDTTETTTLSDALVTLPIKYTGLSTQGTFTRGRKTGLWAYYNGDKKLREETYQNGRRVRVRKCPCK